MVKPISGYEGHYTISSDGVVMTLPRKKTHWRVPTKRADRVGMWGYKYLTLYKNGKSKTFKIHRLVAIAFIPNPLNKKYVNHKNGIKTDNRVENLEWVTSKENIRHAWDTGLSTPKFGETNGYSKLTDKERRQLVFEYANKAISQSELSKKYNLTQSGVSAAVRGFLKRYFDGTL